MKESKRIRSAMREVGEKGMTNCTKRRKERGNGEYKVESQRISMGARREEGYRRSIVEPGGLVGAGTDSSEETKINLSAMLL